MANDIDMLEDFEFENQINAMGDDQPALIKFVARQQFATSKVLVSHNNRIKKVEGQNKRVLFIIGSFGAVIATAFIETLNYFLRRPS